MINRKMVNRQELKKNIEGILERTRVFNHVKVKGDLDYEGSSIVIEYKGSFTRNFRKVVGVLDVRISSLIENEYVSGIEVRQEDLGDRNYKLILKRIPCEGMGRDITDDFLRSLRKYLSNKFLFK